MAFVRLDKTPRGVQYDSTPALRMGCHNQGGEHSARGISFSLSQSLVALLGWKVNTSDARRWVPMSVDEGAGEDAGFLLLSHDPAKGYIMGTSKEHAHSFMVSVSLAKFKHYVLNEVPITTGPVEFTIDEKSKTVLVQCPDWLRYNPQSYQAPPPQPEVRQQQVRPPTKAEVADATKRAEKDTGTYLNRKQRRAVVATVVSAMK